MTKWTIPEPADALETIRQLRARIDELEAAKRESALDALAAYGQAADAYAAQLAAEARAEAAEAMLARAYEAARDDALAISDQAAIDEGPNSVAPWISETIRAMTPPADLAARLGAGK